MAGEISIITGAFADAFQSPATASANRSGSQRPVAPPGAQDAPDTSALHPKNDVEGLEDGQAEDKKLLQSKLERDPSELLADNTTLSFERDSEDGKMYLHVKDKRTGEEIYRIPQNYLKNVDSHLRQLHRVDVRI
ncbi:MAG: flagellar protein FlaG [Acidobacteriia bacterium]|nr:flagellar protein FlaG [Terriglobia bacterium]